MNCFAQFEKFLPQIITIPFFNPRLYLGGGINLPPGSFLLQLKNGWFYIAETLWLLLLAYYTSFGILFGILSGHQRPKLLPW